MSFAICRNRIGAKIAPAMKWNAGPASVGVPILFVRSFLANRRKAEPLEDCCHFHRLEDWVLSHCQASITVWVPTNSETNGGSPSSSSISMTSRRLLWSSSNVSACVCAPGNPGTCATYRPVSGHFSTTAVKILICKPQEQCCPSHLLPGNSKSLHARAASGNCRTKPAACNQLHSPPPTLLPLDRAGGFGANVIDHAVDAACLVDDAKPEHPGGSARFRTTGHAGLAAKERETVQMSASSDYHSPIAPCFVDRREMSPTINPSRGCMFGGMH